MGEGATPVDILLYILCFCRFIAIVTTGIVGLLIAGKTSGLQYYSLVPEDDTWSPYCRIIVFPESQSGDKIDFFEFGPGGETIIDTGIEIDIGLMMSAIQDDSGVSTKVEIRGKLLGDGECDFVVLDSADSASGPPKVLIMNGATGNQMKMKASCGGEKPGKWVDKGNADKGDGGMWMIPLIVTCLFWTFGRVFQVGAEAVLISRHTKGDLCKTVGVAALSIIFSVAMNFFISPLSSMEVLECPQLVTSWYSGTFHSAFVATCAGLACCGCCAGFWAYNYKTIENIWWLPFVLTFGLFVFALVGGVWYSYENFLGYFFLGINLDLELKFPEFSIAYNIGLLHIFSFLVWLLDILKNLVKLFKLCESQ